MEEIFSLYADIHETLGKCIQELSQINKICFKSFLNDNWADENVSEILHNDQHFRERLMYTKQTIMQEYTPFIILCQKLMSDTQDTWQRNLIEFYDSEIKYQFRTLDFETDMYNRYRRAFVRYTRRECSFHEMFLPQCA